MSSTQIIILIAALLILAILVIGVFTVVQRQRLRQRFGPEYDRTLAERESRSEAEKELRERERRHAELTLRPLSERSREGYAEEWARVQARFVDAPEEAVRDGDALVTRLVGEIGYPTGDYEVQLATLSVEHARTLGHYRDAHDIFLRAERGEASTEQLRQALVHYRALFAELLGAEPVPPPEDTQSRGGGVRQQPTPPPAAPRPDEVPPPNQRSRAASHPDYR